MTKLKIHHLRKNNKLIGTIVYYPPDEKNETNYALTFVSRKDHASRKRGREIALGRMKILEEVIINRPDEAAEYCRMLQNRRVKKQIVRKAKRDFPIFKEKVGAPIQDVYDILNAFRTTCEKTCKCSCKE